MQEGRDEMDKQNETQSAKVSQTKQAEESLRQRWSWVQRDVWTDRMLEALEAGIKGGKWFSLMDKVYRPGNLMTGWVDTARNKGSAGVDGQKIPDFREKRDEELARLSRELKEGTYQPMPVRRTWIEKPGSKDKRPLGIPAVRDRTVQGALKSVIEPIFENAFAEHSYGFRPGRGCKDALRRVDQLLSRNHGWVVDVDFKGYFDSIPHERLMDKVRELIADGRVLTLIEKYLKAGVLEGLEDWQPSETGTPQGAVISPLLANLYLNGLDHMMAKAGYEMTRYADDFVVQCQTREEAEAAMERIKEWSQEQGLTIHPEKTRIVDATQPGGFDFLGYHFEQGKKWPRAKSLRKFSESIRECTKKTNGNSMEGIIAKLNPRLRGWIGYYRHSVPYVIKNLDGRIRRRLRMILLKRSKKRGEPNGWANRIWPNAHFEQLGLFCMSEDANLNCQF